MEFSKKSPDYIWHRLSAALIAFW